MKNEVKENALVFIRLVLIYLLISVPFKVMEIIPAFSDIRPVTMLAPIFAVLNGPVGCLAYAFGNLLTDIISDSFRYSSVAGFIGNFMGPYVIYLYWVHISRESIRLDTPKRLLIHCIVIIISAAVTDIIIAPAVYMFYPQVDIKMFAFLLLMNHALFPIAIGIPMLILMQEEMEVKPIQAKKSRS